MNEHDLVFTKDRDGNIKSAGYVIQPLSTTIMSTEYNSEFPMEESYEENENIHNQEGGRLSTLFGNLAVPAGLFYLQQTFQPDKSLKTLKNNTNIIEESLYDKLLNMVDIKKQKRYNKQTRKQEQKKKQKNKKTKRSKR